MFNLSSTPTHRPLLWKQVLAVSALALSGLGAHAATVSYTVYAQQNSTALSTHDASPLDTGLVFTAGDLLTVTASGTWDGGCGVAFGPDGALAAGFACGAPLIDATTGLYYFSLVGRIGTGNWFTLGSSFSNTVTSSGHLFLGFLDTDSANNSGSVTARVTGGVSAIPEPGTLALLLAAAGAGLMVPRRRAAPAA